MSLLISKPGVTDEEVTLELTDTNNVGQYTGNDPMGIPAMTDITINMGKNSFSWTQLDLASMRKLPTTADNSITGTLKVDKTAMFGDGVADGVQDIGLFGLQQGSVLVSFALFTGKAEDGTAGKTITGDGYITNLAMTVSSESGVWESPFTIEVTGDLAQS